MVHSIYEKQVALGSQDPFKACITSFLLDLQEEIENQREGCYTLRKSEHYNDTDEEICAIDAIFFSPNCFIVDGSDGSMLITGKETVKRARQIIEHPDGQPISEEVAKTRDYMLRFLYNTPNPCPSRWTGPNWTCDRLQLFHLDGKRQEIIDGIQELGVIFK